MPGNLPRAGYTFLILSILLWSSVEVVTRLVVGRITPVQLAAVRFGGGALFLAPFLVWEMRRRGLRPTPTRLAQCAGLGLLGVTLTNLLYQFSLVRTGAAVVATVWGAYPLMVLVLAAVFLREPMTPRKVTGVLIGFAGIAIISLSRPSATFSLTGFLLAVGCTFCFAIFTVLVKRWAGSFAGLPVTGLSIAWGAAFLVPMALAEGAVETLPMWPAVWPHLVYLAIGGSGLAYLFYFLGLQRVEATRASSVVFLKPPLATVLAALVLREPVTWNLAIGLALVLLGLYQVLIRRERPPVAASEPAA